jgi:formylglycine-generating enzyme required for sulfatase activity
LSRAELLLALELGQDPKVCAPAPDAEYVEPPRRPTEVLDLGLPRVTQTETTSETSALPARSSMQWLWLLSEQIAMADVAPSQAPEGPLPDLPPLPAEVIERAFGAAQAPANRSGWRSLRVQLQSRLSRCRSHPTPDWPAACAKLARGQPLWPLPIKKPRKWPGSLVLIEDVRGDLALYEGEWQALRTRLQRSVGKAGLRSHLLRRAHAALPAMPHGQPVLLLSDALCEGGDVGLAHWAQRVQRHGYPLLAWQPAAWSAGHARAMGIGTALRPNDPRLQQLIALVYLLRYVEDALLRTLAVRLLPSWGALSLIHALQRHPAVARGYSGVAIAPAALADPDFRAQMEACLQTLSPDTLRAVLADWRSLHAVLTEVDRLGPALRFPTLLPQLGHETAALNAHARHALLHALPEAMREPSTVRQAALSALRVARFLAPSCALAEQLALSGLYRHAQQQLGEAESAGAWPHGLHPSERDAEVGDWQLRQVGDGVVLEVQSEEPISRARLATLPLANGSLLRLTQQNRHRDLRLGAQTLALANAGRRAAPAGQPPTLRIRTPHHQLALTAMPRPSWALGWGRDQAGAFVLAPSLTGKPHRFQITEGAALDPDQPLLQRGQAERLEALPDAPGAKLGIGVDRYGLFATVQIQQVMQKLRWLPPGEFLMGSPESEERFDRFHTERPRHRVRLSEGCWLADTACTQAFWLAVVGGENPSRFVEDPLLPVEQVSWDDVTEKFLPGLQAMLGASVEVQLPSEAQWEYACRAGTTTPFWFGETITPEQVNYNGNYPYGKAKKGLYRQRTVPVASLPANGWGFYEMHGNVWEWCRDGLRTYGSEPVKDPEGPQASASGRVLRGGSWFFLAVSARSACRSAGLPGLRSDDFGFRFGLRSLSPDPIRPEGDQVRGPEGRSGRMTTPRLRSKRRRSPD